MTQVKTQTTTIPVPSLDKATSDRLNDLENRVARLEKERAITQIPPTTSLPGLKEAYAQELRDIQIAVTRMLADSKTSALTPITTGTYDMDTVQTTDTIPLVLSAYLTGLNADGFVKSNATYTFTADGIVTQIRP